MKVKIDTQSAWRFVLITIWVALCVHTLISYCTHDLAWTNGEVYTIFFLKMSALTFPSGMLVVTCGEYAVAWFKTIGLDISLYFNYKSTVLIIWTVMTISGLIQWFFIIPHIYGLFRRKES